MTKRKDNPADQPFGDSRLAEFLRRARPILAAERGWNAQSRMKLKSLADDLHLPRPLFEAALRQLQDSVSSGQVELTRYERHFVRFLEEQLKPLIGNVMTLPFERRAIGHGQRDFQIEHDRARELLRQVAHRMGIGRVSRLDAAEHVAALIDDAIAQATTANATTRSRIFESAKHWGVDPEQTGILIDNRLAANLQSMRPRSSIWIITLAIFASAGVLALVVWFLWAQLGPDNERNTNMKNNSSDSTMALDSPITDVGALPDFWSETTRRLWQEMQSGDGMMSIPRHLVESADGADRRQAIAPIVDLALCKSEPVRHKVQQFLIQIIDEDREISGPAINAMVARILLNGDLETISMRLIEEAFCAADFMQICKEQSTDKDVRGQIDDGMAESLGLSNEPGTDLTRQEVDTRMTRMAWQQLDAVASQNAELAARLYSPLFKLTQARSRETEALAWPVGLAIFSKNGEAWQWMREAWQVSFASASEDQLFQAFDVQTTCDDLDRSTWLLSVLAARMGIDGEGVSASKISDTIRARFGLTGETWIPAEARWDLLLDLPDYRVALEPDQRPTPQAIANAAWLATAAFLIWKAEQDTSSRFLDSFDQLIADGPQAVAIRGNQNRYWQSLPIYGRVQRRPLPTDIETRRLALEKLQNPAGLSSTARASALERLAEIADRFADVSPEQATAIVRIMLLANENPEIVAVEKFTFRFRHWANLATALSEQIMEPEISIDQAVTVASLLTELKFELHDTAAWRESLRRALLRQLADGLQRTAETQGDHADYQWDELHDYLMELGRIRCQAAGIAGHEFSPTRSPAELSRLILRQMIGDDPRIASTQLLADDNFQEAILTTALLTEVVNDDAAQAQLDNGGQSASLAADCPTALLACEQKLLAALVQQRKRN